jgi:hypothetical protein
MMPQRIDLTGQRFGRWTAIHRLPKSNWLCRCDCGTEGAVKLSDLCIGRSQSCGCLRNEQISRRRSVDMAGQRFGKLVVIARAGSDKHNKVIWTCACDCGGSTTAIGSDLRAGKQNSCGCSKRVAYSKVKSEVGNVYDRLTVLRWWGTNRRHRAKWLCQCECGNQTIVLGDYLRCGDTKSCGCALLDWAAELGRTIGKHNQTDDNVRKLRADENHASRPCLLYFVEVGGQYDKIGITNNLDRRSNGAYTEIWHTRATNRATAWAVEQVALRLTEHARPKGRVELGKFKYGHSELREGLAIDETIELLDGLLEEADELGWLEFATKHGLPR